MRHLKTVLMLIKKCNLIQFIYYNYLCRNIKRKKGAYIIPYKNSIISLDKNAEVILNARLVLNNSKVKNSKAECYFVMGEGARLLINGDVYLRYGSTLQINKDATAEFGNFTTNVGANIQCNNYISIGDDCMIGRNVMIYDSSYHPTGTDINHMEVSEAPVYIGNHVWLGSNTTVSQGSKIGDGCIIGMNSRISGEIESMSTIMPGKHHETAVGMLWARSMGEIHAAKKYVHKKDVEDEADLDRNTVLENESRIYNLLKESMSGIDFQTEMQLIDRKLLDSLSLITVVSLLSDEFKIDIPYTEVSAHNFNSVHNMAVLMAKLSSKSAKGGIVEKKDCVATGHLKPLNLHEKDADISVVQHILNYSKETPDEVAIIVNDKEISYIELGQMIVSLHKWLLDQGIKKGDCVVVQASHDEICIAMYYAIHLTEAILVPTEKSATKDRILEIAQETKASMIVGLNKEKAEISWISFKDARMYAKQYVWQVNEVLVYPSIDSPCEMVFTTGTTGKSKGVLMTHRHMSWYSYSLAKTIEMKKGNRFFITTPLNHAGGLRRTHLSLANGCTVVYMDGLNDLSRYFEYIEKYKVTALYLPPVAIRILLTRTGDELVRFKNQIDFVYSSSSSLPVGDCEALSKLLPNTRLYNAYEASETPGVSAYNYNTENVLKNCMGKANEGVELGILLDNGKITTTHGVEGQICVRSKMNMKEYYLAPELTASVWKDSWFVSNDLGKLDADGNIFYNGRKGDVINIGGYKIAPTDVEEVALLSGYISECICIESIDEFGIEFLKLLVVPRDINDFDKYLLTNYMAEKLETYKLPRKIKVIDEVHKTFNGKIDRKFYRK